jgi:hypothetical protein
MHYQIRRWVSHVEEVVHDGHAPGDQPLIKAAVGVLFKNPLAGRDDQDLSALIGPSDGLGTELGRRGQELLRGRAVQSYGKGGVVGTNGEQEHAVACVTSVFGDALRASVGGGLAWISSVTKVAAAGVSIDVPLAHKDALYVRSHYDAVTLTVPDGPRPDEILICAAFATGGRVHERSGGPTAENLVGDGLR